MCVCVCVCGGGVPMSTDESDDAAAARMHICAALNHVRGAVSATVLSQYQWTPSLRLALAQQHCKRVECRSITKRIGVCSVNGVEVGGR